ncbi:MAG: ECF transporter S component [Lachnospiraceae bacterium]
MRYQYRKRKMRARELVLLALLTALAVTCSILCAATFPLHLGTAVVILSGIALGGKSGFIVGSMTMLLNNFYLGQGIWTPFQMVAMGLLGACTGYLLHPHTGKKQLRWIGAGMSFFAVIVIYGGIMNFFSFLSMTLMVGGRETLDWSSVLGYYISGIPYDLQHAVTTAVWILLLEPMFVAKIERVKVKYGFYRT